MPELVSSRSVRSKASSAGVGISAPRADRDDPWSAVPVGLQPVDPGGEEERATSSARSATSGRAWASEAVVSGTPCSTNRLSRGGAGYSSPTGFRHPAEESSAAMPERPRRLGDPVVELVGQIRGRGRRP